MKVLEYEGLARLRIVRAALSAFGTLAELPIRLVPWGAEVDGEFDSSNSNPFCRLISRTERGKAGCENAIRTLQAQLDRKPCGRAWQCFAGFTELAVPVVAKGAPVAALVCGGFLQRRPAAQDFDRCVQRLGQTGTRIDSSGARKAYFASAVVPRVRLQAARRLLKALADHLGQMAGHCLPEQEGGDPPCVSCAKTFVMSHGGELPRTREMARAAHVTEPYFCRRFRAATGMPFSEYAARYQVDRAKDLLHAPKLRVTDVALAVGFQSIPHFNHTFKRYTGVSPMGYRVSLAAKTS